MHSRWPVRSQVAICQLGPFSAYRRQHRFHYTTFLLTLVSIDFHVQSFVRLARRGYHKNAATHNNDRPLFVSLRVSSRSKIEIFTFEKHGPSSQRKEKCENNLKFRGKNTLK